MGRGVRIILFNADESAAADLRSILLSFEGVKIVAEVDEPVILPQIADQIPADVLLAHLDPDPEQVLAMAGEVARAHPETMVVAVSESTDGQLILSAMRMGVKEFLPKPLDPQEISRALEKVSESEAASENTGKLISVVGSAGGVGASIIATNLAVELNEMTTGSVAVVDLDYRFGQVGTLLDLDPTYTIADLCESPEQLEAQVIERALVKHDCGVHALCRPTHFAQADNITAAHAVGVLSLLCGLHEYVIVDGPNRFDIGAKSVLDIADATLLVTQLLVPSVRSARRIVEGMREAGYGPDRIKVVCNRVGKESGDLSLDDIQATLDSRIFAALPDDWATMCNAVNMGEPLLTAGNKSKVRWAIAELAERIHNPPRQSDDEDGSRKRTSLLSRIFSE